MHDVGGGGDEIAAVRNHHRVLTRRLVERAQERDRIHELAVRPGLFLDFGFTLQVARAQVLDPGGPAAARLRERRDEALEEQARVADRRDVGPPVHARFLGAAVRGDERGAAPHVTPVVETEVAGHAREHDAVGLAQRRPALVPHLQRVIAPEQAAGHARQIHRNAQLRDRCGDARRLRRNRERLAADDNQRPLGPRQGGRCGLHAGSGGRRRRHGAHCRRRRVGAASEHFFHMPREIEAQQPVRDRRALAGGVGVPLADACFVV